MARMWGRGRSPSGTVLPTGRPRRIPGGVPGAASCGPTSTYNAAFCVLRANARLLAYNAPRQPMFEQAFRNIDDVLRKEAGCTTELDYTEQTSWLLFLKYLDGLE